LGYQQKHMAVKLDFGDKAPALSEYAVGYGVSQNHWIMAPMVVELWAEAQPNQWTLIKTAKPPQTTQGEGRSRKIMNIPLDKPQRHRYYKLVVKTVEKLPRWHKYSGKRGWVFVDQLFFYESPDDLPAVTSTIQ